MLVEAVSAGDDKQVQSAVNREYILKITNNLITASKDDIVQFAHLSVREYLQTPERQHPEFNDANANIGTAMSCVSYLLSEYTALRGPFSLRLTSFAEYVLLYWPIHAEKAGESGRQGTDLGSLLWDLFSPGNKRVLDTWEKSQDMLWDLFDEVILSWGQGDCFRIKWHLSMRRLWRQDRQLAPFLFASEDPKYTSKVHPFLLACAWGFSEIVAAMLEDGKADEYLRLRNDIGATGLIIAARFGHAKTVEQLLRAGANSTETDELVERDALEWATQADHVSVVRSADCG